MKPPTDPIVDAIAELLARVEARRAAAVTEIQQEIKQRGTAWAADQIWRLRQYHARSAQSVQPREDYNAEAIECR